MTRYHKSSIACGTSRTRTRARSTTSGSASRISFVFKDIRGEFLKRAEDDVHFACEDGPLIQEMVARALDAADGSVEGAAEKLGLSANALRKRIKRRNDDEEPAGA